MAASLLDLLARHVGGDKIRRVSAAKGGLYHSPCPACGGTDRFMVYTEQPGGELAQQHGLPGTWACPRHCQTGGDIISFLQEFDKLSFRDACTELGITPSSQPSRIHRPLRRPQSAPNAFVPQTYPSPSSDWMEHATKLAVAAHAAIHDQPSVLAWLATRGLPLEAVTRYRLGWLAGEDKTGKCLYRARAAFGLPAKAGKNGKPMRSFWIPRGITIPDWDNAGNCRRLQIRRPNKDIDPAKKHDPKYMYVSQPDPAYTAPQVLPPVSVTPELATWVVVEARLDAMAVHHACGGRVGVVALLTVSGRPDSEAHAVLSRSARILTALDFDAPREDGSPVPTAKAWPWWEATYPQAKLWPVPQGKDPGDAFTQGLNLWDWVRAGMPLGGNSAPEYPVRSLGQSSFESSLRGSGEGESGIAVADAVVEPPVRPWPEYFGAWMPAASVVALAKFWRGKPIEYRKGGGWWCDPKWGRYYPQAWHDFLTLAQADDVWRWMSEHEADVITSRNFLYIWGPED